MFHSQACTTSGPRAVHIPQNHYEHGQTQKPPTFLHVMSFVYFAFRWYHQLFYILWVLFILFLGDTVVSQHQDMCNNILY